ncbi:MAG: NAD(P)-dependent oxidoreductase [Magnetococcales bacterium]|nr:NAD(P)-dependent oxidoreductase [Magnetococcales bacterium]
MKVLVTGGAGYLGSVLVPALLEAGYHVTVVDNFLFRQSSLNSVCIHPDFRVFRGDARRRSFMKPLVKEADIIIPLAALVGAPLCERDEIGTISTNRDAVTMLSRDLMGKDQWLLIPITNSGYGIGDRNKACDETSPLNPISLYGRMKVEAEAAALERDNTISFRFATVFGMSPRMRMDLLVNDFVYRAFHDRAVVLFESHFQRNYLHVRDVARTFLHALDRFTEMRGEPYNVGLSDANLSKLELCRVIQRHLPHFVFPEAPIGEDPDKRDYIISNDKIEATGFTPAYSLDDGIQELIKGYAMLRNTVFSNV